MTRPAKLLMPALAVSALIAGCGGSSSPTSASYRSTTTTSAATAAAGGATGSTGALVRAAASSSLGKTVLVDAQGMTLYALSGEHGGRFICASSSCEQIWRPLTVQAGSSPGGTVGALGTVMRPDGAEQVTYSGMPLYTFARDRAPGEANGQGVKDVGTWSVVTTGGGGHTSTQSHAQHTAAPAPSSSPYSPSGGGAGYGEGGSGGGGNGGGGNSGGGQMSGGEGGGYHY